MSAITKALTGLFLGVLLLLALGDAFDLVKYWRDPSLYGFGTEVAGFRYLSPTHFMVSIVVTIIGALSAVLAPRVISSSSAVLAVRGVLVILLLGFRYA
ncbi:hypothetical protein BURK2_02909 [Burkholderiales bacterium]|jgi:hypothetical protein|nr:hypothetical protein BURK2_02909 [Burkholderiales bacterium]